MTTQTLLWNHLEVRERGTARLVTEFTAADGDRIDVAYSTRHDRPWSRITAWRCAGPDVVGGTVFDRILDHQELQAMSAHSLVLSGWLLPGANPVLVDGPGEDEDVLLEVYVALRRRELVASEAPEQAAATA